MTKSFTDFRGHGFWSHDTEIELFLLLLSREVTTAQSPPWLLEARDDWSLQATAGFHGCVSAGLDRHIGEDPARLAIVRELSRKAQVKLLSYVPTLTPTVMNSFGLGGGKMYSFRETDVASFLRVAKAFDQLLAGTIQWDGSTSPVL